MPCKYLLDNSKAAAAYRAQRLQSLMQDPMHAVADAAGTGSGSDPIAAALDAHNRAMGAPKKKQSLTAGFFDPNASWK